MKNLILLFCLLSVPAFAEYSSYGEVDLNGLARESWPLNRPGIASAMVCNVNGRDRFLSIRSGPGTGYRINRNLKRLAIVEVDTRYREGRWIAVRTAYRNHTENGLRLRETQDLHVQGWAHDGYLCDFLD